MESGTIYYLETTKIEKAKYEKSVVFRFSEWGAKERRETWEGTSLIEILICDGERKYLLQPDIQVAWDQGPADGGIGYRASWDSVPEASKKDKKAQQIASLKFLGKTCPGYTIDVEGGKATYFGYMGLLIRSETTASSISQTLVATKLVENEAHGDELFKVPSTYTVKKR
jgi:hypothetical protein